MTSPVLPFIISTFFALCFFKRTLILSQRCYNLQLLHREEFGAQNAVALLYRFLEVEDVLHVVR